MSRSVAAKIFLNVAILSWGYFLYSKSILSHHCLFYFPQSLHSNEITHFSNSYIKVGMMRNVPVYALSVYV